MKPMILASSSPRRREILTLTGLPFEVLTPSVEEGEIPLTDPDIYVEELSLIKCRAGLREAAEAHTQALVIGADTIVCHNGHILGNLWMKRMLLICSGSCPVIRILYTPV